MLIFWSALFYGSDVLCSVVLVVLDIDMWVVVDIGILVIDSLILSMYVSRRACQGRRRRERTTANWWRGFRIMKANNTKSVEDLPSRVVSWPPASRRGL